MAKASSSKLSAKPSRKRATRDDSDSDADDSLPQDYGNLLLSSMGFDPASLPSTSQPTPSQPQLESSTAAEVRKQQQGKRKTKPLSEPPAASTSPTRPSPLAPRPIPETVVFNGSGTSSGRNDDGDDTEATNTFVDSKAARKAFMSSRISQITADPSSSSAAKGKGKARNGEDAEQEKEHQANDRLLSHLLSTTLFAPASQNQQKSNGKPALDPSKGTLSTILELTSTSDQRKGLAIGRGWGEAQARIKEVGKMPARMQAGMKRAAKERVDKEQARATELGLVHRSLNKGSKRTNLGGTGAVSTVDMALSGRGASSTGQKRVRGLGMGVGKFGGGKLVISARDVEKINGPSRSGGGPGGSRGRGGGPAKKKQRRN
ncbi:hypothetical protein OC846_004954 [Tilletia horrida]|uniref:Uncharacterized protein n=1 Tax=Tilletia horrida TaxID=155126 RepID=A0AAN6GMC8_9BASI|nr:hypothetical protein OC846_004954 [Tilletia horrida]KAK0563777.1 hypothetical protein OC861_004623 [Tilletia horrida]